MSDRTRCLECDEELWGPEEAHGFCVRCRLRSQDDDDRFDHDYRNPDSDPLLAE